VSREACAAVGLSLLLAAGCTGLKDAPPATATVSTPVVESPAALVPVPEPAAAEALEPHAAPIAPTQVQPVRPPAPAAAPRPAVSKVASSSAVAIPQVTTAKPQPAAVPAPALPTTPAPTTVHKAAPAPVAARPATPPLDLKSLEARLRETQAIGVFTKISLKNQVDDLLNQFRAYHKHQTTTLAALRQSYNLLLLKVLTLLQDSDPALARDIVASREAIWGILSDQKRFIESNLMAGVMP
jgi:hypothetical protein